MVRNDEKTVTEWLVLSLALVAVVLAFLAACGGPGNEREATPTRASAPITGSLQATPYRITIEGLGYTNLTVPARALISVVNKDDVKHTVTSAAQGVFDVDVPPHAEAQFHAPATPGDYAYHCTYHPAMFGVLTVT